MKESKDKLLLSLGLTENKNSFSVTKEKELENNSLISSYERKLSSLIDLLENFKSAKGSDLGLNLSKKTLQETDFNSFIEYIKVLFNNLEYAKVSETLSSLVDIIDNNSTNHSITFVDYSSVKILSLWLKLCSDFISEKSSDILNSSLTKIHNEIKNLDSFNTQFMNQNGFEYIEVNLNSVSAILNQIPILRSYMINWSLLKLNSNNCLLKNVEDFLDIVLDFKNFNLVKSFDYLVPYTCALYLINKKTKYLNQVLELADLHSNSSFSQLVLNINGEFELDSLIQNQQESLEFIKKDFFLNKYQDIFIYSSSQLIVNVYSQLNSNLDKSKVSKLKIGDNYSSIEYLKYCVDVNCPSTEIIHETDKNLIYTVNSEKYDGEVSRKANNIQMISKSIINHLNSIASSQAPLVNSTFINSSKN